MITYFDELIILTILASYLDFNYILKRLKVRSYE